MENLVTGKPTYSTVGGTNYMTHGMPEYKAPENVTKIIENVTTVDMTGLEDCIKDLISTIQAMPKPHVNVAAPQVTVQPSQVALPTFHVEAPEVKVEPKIEITVSTHWLFFATLFPTLSFLADIYVRMVYR
jgi:hypothetical protein